MTYLMTRKEYESLEEKETKIKEQLNDVESKLEKLAYLKLNTVDNSEYLMLKKQFKEELPERLKVLASKKLSAKIAQFDGKTVIIGTKVTLDYDGEIETYKVVTVSLNGLDDNEISCISPIACLILGKKVGDQVKFNNYNVKILNVEEI